MHTYISQKLLENNFECYFVGGYVRDSLLGIHCEDVDLATNAKPEEIIKIFENDKILRIRGFVQR